MRIALSVLLAMCALCLGFQALAQEKGDEKPAANELRVKNVKSAPPLKAELGEAWKDVPALELALHEGTQKAPKVTLRAQFDGSNIYILAQWADATKSDTKGAWEFKEGKWTKQKGDEDRIAFAFNVSSPAFAEKGCTGACHGYSEKKMHCLEKDGLVDLWHWKAARGGQNGWADDQVINAEKRADDAGKSAYKPNVNEKDAALPRWHWPQTAGWRGVFDENAAAAIDDAYKPEEGEVLPSHVMREPDGSRADVKAYAAWQDGNWTVLLVRADGTGQSGDVRFGVGRFAFSVALFDDTGAKKGDEHAKSGLCWLVIEK